MRLPVEADASCGGPALHKLVEQDVKVPLGSLNAALRLSRANVTYCAPMQPRNSRQFFFPLVLKV